MAAKENPRSELEVEQRKEQSQQKRNLGRQVKWHFGALNRIIVSRRSGYTVTTGWVQSASSMVVDDAVAPNYAAVAVKSQSSTPVPEFVPLQAPSLIPIGHVVVRLNRMDQWEEQKRRRDVHGRTH